MIFKNVNTIAFAAAAALALLGCGSSKPSTSATVVAGQPTTLSTGTAALTIQADALPAGTAVTMKEAEPNHANRVLRLEIEPHNALANGKTAQVSVKVNNSNPKCKMHNGDDDSLEDVEVEDHNHHQFKTSMTTLGNVEVEVEDGKTCASDCPTGQECDDGLCKLHNDAAKTCTDVCDAGSECDDGLCKTHLEVETENETHGGQAGSTTCSPTCDAPAVCHDGVCSAHG